MKVLWIVNILMPDLALEYGLKETVGGGWLVGLYTDLSKIANVELVICCPTDKKELNNEGSRIRETQYYFFERNVKPCLNEKTTNRFEEIIRIENPDIIHIWGTEYAHSLQAYYASEKLRMNERVVVSIQGLVSVYARHYYAGLSEKIVNSRTLLECIKRDNLRNRHDDFVKRGRFEAELIKKTNYVIGRTDWDKACTSQINDTVTYFHCNETLRPSFYISKWEYDKCEKHSIFFTQCSVPLKGFHILLDAMPLIKKDFPDAKIYITGNLIGINSTCSLKDRLKERTYDKYLSEKIRELGLSDSIVFLGPLDEIKMKEMYQKCNVFVLASSIENSPNSLGEAMILGTPCVAAHVGGVTSMIKQDEEGYVFDVNAPYMLAYYVCQVFKNKERISEMTEKARKHAQRTHNREENSNRIMQIYEEMIEQRGE